MPAISSRGEWQACFLWFSNQIILFRYNQISQGLFEAVGYDRGFVGADLSSVTGSEKCSKVFLASGGLKYFDNMFRPAMDRRVAQTTVDRNGRIVARLIPS